MGLLPSSNGRQGRLGCYPCNLHWRERPMTAPDQPHSVGAARLHEIAPRLAEVGVVTHLHRTRTGTDLTATLHPAGHRDIQVIVDEDGYTELRYWASLSTTPSAAVTTIASALEALT